MLRDRLQLAARVSVAVSVFVKAVSKILRAGQAPSVTIPRTPWPSNPHACPPNLRNRVFQLL